VIIGRETTNESFIERDLLAADFEDLFRGCQRHRDSAAPPGNNCGSSSSITPEK
jgi:hypothetical protein